MQHLTEENQQQEQVARKVCEISILRDGQMLKEQLKGNRLRTIYSEHNFKGSFK